MIRVGTGKAILELSDGLGLFGYGPIGGRGYNPARGSAEFDRLQVRALYLEDGGRRLLVLTYDIAAGSRLLHAALLEGLKEAGLALHPGELWVAGTHTHAGPGHYFGNLYDAFGQWPPGSRPVVLQELRDKGLTAARQALAAPRNALIGIAEERVWVGANRSLRCFLSNFDGELARWDDALGGAAPTGTLYPEERAIDPRLRVVAFVGEDGASLATWASYCCHPATLPPASWRAYHRDWPGVAVDAAEAGVPFAMLQMASNGDVTALAPGELTQSQPLARVHEIGSRVGAAWSRAHERAKLQAKAVDMELGFLRFVPGEWRLPRWDIGMQVVAGAPEINPGSVRRALVGQLRCRLRGAGQRPKLSVLGPLTPLVSAALGLAPSPEHPLWLLRLGSHVFFSAPFEQTTFAAFACERRLIERWSGQRGEQITASAVGLVGDYAGYVTTRAEYQHQHYEGAHTLYGAAQHEALIEAWEGMINREPLVLDNRLALDERRLKRAKAPSGDSA